MRQSSLPNPRQRGRFLRRWLLASLAFTSLIGVWSLSQPPYGGSDEMSHIIKAVATVRGQLLGGADPNGVAAIRTFEVPKVFSRNTKECFAYHGEAAGCQRFDENDRRVVTANSSAGRYPPLYYALVGLPSLFSYTSSAFYEMRLVSALLSGLLLGAGFALASLYGSRILRVGILVGVTPQIVYFASMVNPSGIEMTAAVAAWVSWLILVKEAKDPPPCAVVVAAVSTSVLALSRPVSVFWVVLLLSVVAVCSSPKAIRALLRWTSVKIALVLTAICSAISLLWAVIAKSYELVPATSPWKLPNGSSFGDYLTLNLHTFLGHRGYLAQSVGMFGWSWIPAPSISLVAWGGALALLVIPALVVGSPRQRAGIIVIVVASFLISLLLPVTQASHLGLVWHGRYILPFLVGLPLVACISLEHRLGWFDTQIVVPVAVLTACGTVASWYVVIRGFVVGIYRHVGLFAHVRNRWNPPLPIWLLIILSVAATIFVTSLVFIEPRRPRGGHSRSVASALPTQG